MVVELFCDIWVLGEDNDCELTSVFLLYVGFKVSDECGMWMFQKYFGVPKGGGALWGFVSSRFVEIIGGVIAWDSLVCLNVWEHKWVLVV